MRPPFFGDHPTPAIKSVGDSLCVSQDGVGDDDKLSCDGGKGEALGLSGAQEALLEGAEGRMGSGGGKRGHEEDRP
jgi:hypothetical protein